MCIKLCISYCHKKHEILQFKLVLGELMTTLQPLLLVSVFGEIDDKFMSDKESCSDFDLVGVDVK